MRQTIPYKRKKLKVIETTGGLQRVNSSEKMKILNSLKRHFTLMREDLEYIKNMKKYSKEYYRELKQETMIGMSQRHLTKLKPCGS